MQTSCTNCSLCTFCVSMSHDDWRKKLMANCFSAGTTIIVNFFLNTSPVSGKYCKMLMFTGMEQTVEPSKECHLHIVLARLLMRCLRHTSHPTWCVQQWKGWSMCVVQSRIICTMHLCVCDWWCALMSHVEFSKAACELFIWCWSNTGVYISCKKNTWK